MVPERAVGRNPKAQISSRNYYHFSVIGSKKFITLQPLRKPKWYFDNSVWKYSSSCLLRCLSYILHTLGRILIRLQFFSSVRETFLKTGFTSACFRCSGKVLVSMDFINVWLKMFRKTSDLFLIILLSISSLWVHFEPSKASNSLKYLL